MVSPALYPSITGAGLYPSITGAGSFAISDKMLGTLIENTVTVAVSEPSKRCIRGSVMSSSIVQVKDSFLFHLILQEDFGV